MKIYIPIEVDKDNLPKGIVLCISDIFEKVHIAAGELEYNGRNVSCDTDAIGCNVNYITHYLKEQEVLNPEELEDLYNEDESEFAAPEEFVQWLKRKGAKIII